MYLSFTTLQFSFDIIECLLNSGKSRVFYDVAFGDGLFDNGIAAFPDTIAAATSASIAIRDQVLLGGWYQWAHPTRGCVLDPSATCSIVTPIFLGVAVSLTYHMITPDGPAVRDTSVIRVHLGSIGIDDAHMTLATWRVSGPAATVPEPEAYAMMFAGLGLLGFLARRRKQMPAV